MASSQVEIPPSSRFGHVLRDRNHQPDSYRSRDSSSALKNLVQTHLSSRISSQSKNSGSGNTNLNQRMDYEDLWVHNPRGPNDENNNIDSSKSELNGISSDHSNANEGSNQSIDFTDLWVHIPERNNDRLENKALGKWDRARDVVISIQRKNRDVDSPKPVWNSRRGESKNDAKSEPISITQRSNSKLGENNQNGRTLEPIRTRGESKNEAKSEPMPISQRSNSNLGENNQNRRTLEPIRTREKPPPQSESSSVKGESENFCGVSSLVSSLVQKWRGYEEKSKSLSLTNSPVCGSKVNSSSLFFAECPSFSETPPSKNFDPSDEPAPTPNENSFTDWESCKTGLSGPSSPGGRDYSDAAESESIKVADIIKKLSSSVEEHTVAHESLSSPRVKTTFSDQAEHKGAFLQVSHSPRLRGRQVFSDLLMQTERERHRELEGLKEFKPVSKFNHKGRIQAMLRLRFLRYGSELKDSQCSKFPMPNTNRKEPSDLRKRLNSGQVDQDPGPDTNSQAQDSVKRQIETENPCIASGCREENSHQIDTEQANPCVVLEDRNTDAGTSSESNLSRGGDMKNHGSESLHQEHSNSSVTHNSASSDSKTQKLSECRVEEITMQELEVHIPSVESNNGISSTTQFDIEKLEDDTRNSVVSDCDSTRNVSHNQSEWEEELQSDYDDRDWINDVSRPRSTWECLRQERYQEMRDPFKEKNDIRCLLETKSVSSFLSSGLRERIDQLMMARTQIPIKPNVHAMVQQNQTQTMKEEEEEEQLQEVKRQEEQVGGDGEKFVQDNEASKYDNEPGSWVRDNASCDNQSDHIESSYIEGSPISSTYSQDTGPSSSFNNNNSIGIELMYEMRGYMEQLRQEVADLRMTVKNCMNMMELQNSFKKEVAPRVHHSGRKKRKDAHHTPRFNGGRCCICYDTQIDTLLYRCGHMCTCFSCAQKLLWDTGKCPVCRAPILDIVKANFLP